ncbi:hypothetical protein [Aerosakkonema funiforme]|uniref:Uncharacterized protein n=1 Tax=Aerosakkonema funiforme FACHB-1375 TaxID=2949571 RepID=A0A926VIL8_9CYAN|nr:hypothetical protein [Aerosakkonema funiforme]MBD2183873.1 hypothetical protein [Aerosakkonema funiforme FACHB-1375]
MKYTISDFIGIFIETSAMDKWMRSSDEYGSKYEFDIDLHVIYIFSPAESNLLPDRHHLAYYHLLSERQDYREGWGYNWIFEEGFVRIADNDSKAIDFYVEAENESGIVRGYDPTSYSQYKIIKRKELYFKNEKFIFKPIMGIEDRSWYFGKNEQEIIEKIQNIRKKL